MDEGAAAADTAVANASEVWLGGVDVNCLTCGFDMCVCELPDEVPAPNTDLFGESSDKDGDSPMLIRWMAATYTNSSMLKALQLQNDILSGSQVGEAKSMFVASGRGMKRAKSLLVGGQMRWVPDKSVRIDNQCMMAPVGKGAYVQ